MPKYWKVTKVECSSNIILYGSGVCGIEGGRCGSEVGGMEGGSLWSGWV